MNNYSFIDTVFGIILSKDGDNHMIYGLYSVTPYYHERRFNAVTKKYFDVKVIIHGEMLTHLMNFAQRQGVYGL